MSSMKNLVGFSFMLFLLMGLHSSSFGLADLEFDNVEVFSECSPTGELLNVSYTIFNAGDDFEFSETPFVKIYSDLDGSGDLSDGDQFIVSEQIPGFIAGGDHIDITTAYTLPFGLQTCPILLVLEDSGCGECESLEYLVSEVPYKNAGNDLALCNTESGQLGCGPGVDGYEYAWSVMDEDQI